MLDAEARLGYHRHPARAANRARNRLGDTGRHERWHPARDAAWRFLDPLLADGSRVAILGAGNGDDLPLVRLAERAGELTLLDLDREAVRRARRRLPRSLRRRLEIVEHDVTGGAAEAIVLAAARGMTMERRIAATPLPGAPYDLVVGDLLYSQLLYPGLLDLDVPAATRSAVLERAAPPLVAAVVERLHVSARPGGAVVHLHDVLGWWPDHDQPASADHLIALAERDPAGALAAIARGDGPHESDPRRALGRLGLSAGRTGLWAWPFDRTLTYLVCATAAGAGAD